MEYKGKIVGEGRQDLLIEGRLMVELNAVDDRARIHSAQAFSCLKTTEHKPGLLINFNVPVLKQGVKRNIL